MSFLVTGGTGFIGSYVVRCLLEHGQQVVSLNRTPDPEVTRLFTSNVEVITGDVSDRAQLAAIFESHPQIDRVVHLGYIMGIESEADPIMAMRVNALGAAILFTEACTHGVKRIVFSSSISLYGRSQTAYGERPVTEDDFCSPQEQSYIYSLTKLLNEHLAIKFEARYGVPIISVRPPIVFGHGRKRGTTAWASDFVSLPTRGHAVTLPFPEDDWNCYIYVADLAEQIYQLSVKPSLSNRIYNSGGHTLAAAEFATLVREQLPGAEIRFSPNRPHSAFIYRLDDRRICSELGSLLRSMRDGIKAHIEEVRRRDSTP